MASGAVARLAGSGRFAFLIITTPGCISNVLVVTGFVCCLPQVEHANLSGRERCAKLDLVGMLLFVPSAPYFALALQLGGGAYSWNDSRATGSLVVVGMLLLFFSNFADFREWWAAELRSRSIS